jgi:glycogen debranching enzyme
MGPSGVPRRAFTVEVQALWYNALLIGADLARAAGQSVRAGEWTALAARVRDAFLRAFWSERHGHLADAVDATGSELALRANQLYAIGLPHVMLPRDKAQRVLESVRRGLLTPVGLRTLAPSDPGYAGGAVEGAPRRPHVQGDAWPFLAPLYFDGLIRIHGEAAKAEAWRWLDGFAPRLEEGIGTLPDAFEGDAPHRPLGDIASAVSVGEVLRLALRLGRRPATRGTLGVR